MSYLQVVLRNCPIERSITLCQTAEFWAYACQMPAMLCDGTPLCPTIPNNTFNCSLNDNNETWTMNCSLPRYTETTPGTPAKDAASRYQIHAMFKGGSIMAILSFCVLVSVCSTSVLLATRWMNSYRGVTFVFLRSLYVSDILMSIYGTSKMIMLLFIEQLNINFFLPESLFFTAFMASTMSLIFLNLDCYLKLARPLQYKEVDNDTVITSMLLMWNVAFIVGFLPLIGWNQERDTVRFFSFYPWHYLFFNGCIAGICLAVCTVCAVSVRRFHTLPKLDFNCFSSRMLEIRNYTYFHGTVILESILWSCCYVPFFIYMVLTCSQCLLSDFQDRDFAVIYFISLFMTKSLLSSVLQMARTFQAYGLISNRILGTSIFKRLTRGRRVQITQKHIGMVDISYVNPLYEYNNFSSHGDIQIMMDHNQPILHPRNRVMEFAELIHDSGFYFSTEDSNASLTGITNNSYRASISSRHADMVSQETTTL